MKNFKSFILFTVIGILAGFLISCGNKDEKDIIALKKASREKAAKSITEFSNEYFMDGDIEKTIKNIGLIAKEGMEKTDASILDIMCRKQI